MFNSEHVETKEITEKLYQKITVKQSHTFRNTTYGEDFASPLRYHSIIVMVSIKAETD